MEQIVCFSHTGDPAVPPAIPCSVNMSLSRDHRGEHCPGADRRRLGQAYLNALRGAPGQSPGSGGTPPSGSAASGSGASVAGRRSSPERCVERTGCFPRWGRPGSGQAAAGDSFGVPKGSRPVRGHPARTCLTGTNPIRSDLRKAGSGLRKKRPGVWPSKLHEGLNRGRPPKRGSPCLGPGIRTHRAGMRNHRVYPAGFGTNRPKVDRKGMAGKVGRRSDSAEDAIGRELSVPRSGAKCPVSHACLPPGRARCKKKPNCPLGRPEGTVYTI